MSRILSWIDRMYNKKVNSVIIMTLFIIGVCLQYVSLKMQVVLMTLPSFVILLFLISALRQKKGMSEITMGAAGFILYIFAIICRIMYSNNLIFIISLVGGVVCVAIIFIAAIKDAYISGDEARIRKVKTGMVFLGISAICIVSFILIELFD